MVVEIFMTDLFKEWKEKRFVVYKDKLIDPNYEFCVVLTDNQYWIENNEALTKWCYNHNCTWTGMVVNIPDEKMLSWFILRWS